MTEPILKSSPRSKSRANPTSFSLHSHGLTRSLVGHQLFTLLYVDGDDGCPCLLEPTADTPSQAENRW